jgi:hypothetical protein
MKKPFKLLTSSALFALTFGFSHGSLGMDSKPSFESAASHTKFLAPARQLLDDSFRQSSFCHHIMIEQYRRKVQALRQDYWDGHARLSLFQSKVPITISAAETEIKRIEEKVSLQQEIWTKYGDADIETTKQKIHEEIIRFQKSKEGMEKSVMENPHLERVYRDQINKENEQLNTCQKHLLALDESENNLRTRLSAAKKSLDELKEEQHSLGSMRYAQAQKLEELNALYEGYFRGLHPHDPYLDLPKIVLKNYLSASDTSLIRLDSLDTKKLFKLFARTMEMPCVALQTGENGTETYEQQIKIIIQNLTHRLNEDVAAFEDITSIMQNMPMPVLMAAEEKKDGEEHEIEDNAQSRKIVLNFGEQDKFVEDLTAKTNFQNLQVLNFQALREEIISKDLDIFKNILLTYGYQDQRLRPSPLLEIIIRQSPFGLLGLCIGALETHPITSWNDDAKIALQTRIRRNINTHKELRAGIIENVYSILGRHINKLVLQEIEKTLQLGSVDIALAPPNMMEDAYA